MSMSSSDRDTNIITEHFVNRSGDTFYAASAKSGDNFREEIDLYAYKPSPVIVFEPFINLGFVQIGDKKTHKIQPTPVPPGGL